MAFFSKIKKLWGKDAPQEKTAAASSASTQEEAAQDRKPSKTPAAEAPMAEVVLPETTPVEETAASPDVSAAPPQAAPPEEAPLVEADAALAPVLPDAPDLPSAPVLPGVAGPDAITADITLEPAQPATEAAGASALSHPEPEPGPTMPPGGEAVPEVSAPEDKLPEAVLPEEKVPGPIVEEAQAPPQEAAPVVEPATEHAIGPGPEPVPGPVDSEQGAALPVWQQSGEAGLTAVPASPAHHMDLQEAAASAAFDEASAEPEGVRVTPPPVEQATEEAIGELSQRTIAPSADAAESAAEVSPRSMPHCDKQASAAMASVSVSEPPAEPVIDLESAPADEAPLDAAPSPPAEPEALEEEEFILELGEEDMVLEEAPELAAPLLSSEPEPAPALQPPFVAAPTPTPVTAPEPAPTPEPSTPPAAEGPAWQHALALELRQAEPKLSVWLSLILEGHDKASPELWERLAYLFQALEAPADEAQAFITSFADWVDDMEYERVADFRSELQYRLALALELEDEEDERSRLFIKLSESIQKTREQLTRQLDVLFSSHDSLSDAFWEELEEVLIMADVGVESAMSLSERLKERARAKGVSDPEAIRELLLEELLEIFTPPKTIRAVNPPEVILIIGVNGVGKTTTIAKLAHRNVMQGRKVLIAAGDTFRAAAVEQLNIWATRVGAGFFAKGQDADPAAVAFEAVDHCLKEGYDLLIVDTAGRLHTKVDLMEELKKIKRVLGKKHPGAPHRSVLVLDSTTGQNALSQTKLFNQGIGVDEIILTKLDGTAKGGVIVAIANQFKLPITFIGLGEKMEDLRPFDGEAFSRALLQ